MKTYVYTNKDGRMRQVIVTDDGRHTSKSYPRVLLEQKLGRELYPYEDVHHIDGDHTNNNLDNLEVVMHGEHQSFHAAKYIDSEEICQICGKKFIMTRKRWGYFFGEANRLNGANRYLTCSKSCAGKLSSGMYPLLYDINDRMQVLDMIKNYYADEVEEYE